MSRLNSVAELEALRVSITKARDAQKPCITVCGGTGCHSFGSAGVTDAFKKEIKRQKLSAKIDVKVTGCHGFCEKGPVVVIKPKDIFYQQVKAEDIPEIVAETVVKGNIVDRLLYIDPATGKKITYEHDVPFYKEQERIVFGSNGLIDPNVIDDYLAIGGYSALAKVLAEMKPQQVIDEVKSSGLRGRGGAGFPTGTKWEFCRKAAGEPKYVIVNCDEGDPGAYMDRSLMEGNPHSVLEGLLIGAYAIGAAEGYIYVRAEYPLAVENVEKAIKQAEEYGLLGSNILGSGFDFKVHVHRGAGAFVCGEETALIASLEGRIGEPRQRPPFPATSGLWGKPTNINNVETWANVPLIINRGADWFRSLGTERSKGTKIFSLVGKVKNTGLVEAPMGMTLGDIVFKIGGGIPNGKKFKAVQTGGPSGGVIPASLLDTPVDFEELSKLGAIMGSGGMIVMDEDTCLVDVARYFLNFLAEESCGKCVPCREGIYQMLKILNRICEGRGREGDIELLQEIGETVRDFSLCALGKTAANPVLSTIKYFRDEYEEHIKRHHCRAAVCEGLVTAPCTHTCPAGVDVPRYIRFIVAGKPAEAVAVIRERIPFPSICGHVCIHPCETKCRRGLLDEAIGIRVLKRFATDNDNGLWKRNSKVAPTTGKKVAVIGSGPTGLTAAYYLAKQGHSVTIFEALPEPGGMMKFGIPDYRLPADILRAEIKEIEDVGVEIKTNARIDSLDKLFEEGYNAVLLAVGAHQDLKMGVPGENKPGVIDCVSFLRAVSLGKEIKLGNRVAVIGGGNAAIDAARTALRLGAKEVTILYRRTRAEMPASAEEIEGAIEEGVKIEFLAAPSKITSKDGHLELESIRMRLGKVDASGRPRPEPINGSEFALSFDTIIAAIGQQPEVPAGFNLATGRGNTVEADADTLATSREGVFAGGDAVNGPASVIGAVADGRRAAAAIDVYLGGSGDIDEKLASTEGEVKPLEESEEEEYQVKIPALPVAERLKSFKQVELKLSEKLAIEEAMRCLRCDLEQREKVKERHVDSEPVRQETEVVRK